MDLLNAFIVMAVLVVATWVGGHVFVWLVSPLLLLGGDVPFTNGLVIVIPKAVRAEVTPEELQAVRAHEWGHIRRLHPYRNLLCAVLGQRRTLDAYRQQELQADDFAQQRGHGKALAAYLSRSVHGFDLYRARRLASA